MSQLRLALVGPLPPPSGGMANQCRQLARLLGEEGVPVEVVQTNAPYRPAWAERLKGIRALFRLIPYKWALWRAAGRNDVVHVMANSDWSWYLFATPAILLARLRRVPVLVNYRGGGAERFFANASPLALATLRLADALVVPSGFLQAVFRQFGCEARVIPNIIDLSRFVPRVADTDSATAHIIITRNLEPVYDIAAAIRAFALLHQQLPLSRMTIAGSGPLLAQLQQLAQQLGVAEAISFAGRIDNDQMAALYQSADVMLNPSKVDNMPISILEAFASGVPVVSTNVGGVPFIAQHEVSALLVEPGDDQAMASAMLRVLQQPKLRRTLCDNGQRQVAHYAWPIVRQQWLDLYNQLRSQA